MASPKEEKMDRFELDELAMKAKKEKSNFPSLLKNSKAIIDRVVSMYSEGNNRPYKDDYISEAYIALFNCLDKYDSDLGAFASYASYAIRQSIMDFKRNKQSMIKLGTTKLDEIKKLESAIMTIEEQGVDMSRENIKKYSGISSEKTLSTVIWAKKVKDCVSLDAPYFDDQEISLIDLIPMEVYMELIKTIPNISWDNKTLEQDIKKVHESLCLTTRDRFIRAILYITILVYGPDIWDSLPVMMCDLAIHFQKGAEKYGERNCEQGIPLWSFIDSGTRHTMQFLVGKEDAQPHISAIWNFWMAEWTCLKFERENGVKLEEVKNDCNFNAMLLKHTDSDNDEGGTA